MFLHREPDAHVGTQAGVLVDELEARVLLHRLDFFPDGPHARAVHIGHIVEGDHVGDLHQGPELTPALVLLVMGVDEDEVDGPQPFEQRREGR